MSFKTSERGKRENKQNTPPPAMQPEETPERVVRAPNYEKSSQLSEKDSATSTATRPKVAVILGSKGVEAFASLPLLNLLDKSGVHVDLVIGCSGGGVMAALWSAGYNLKQIQQFFSHLFAKGTFALPDAEELVRQANNHYTHRSGIYNTSAQFKAYQQIFAGTRIEDLSPATIFHATDIFTGEGVTIDSGPVAPAIQACGALYPIMAPVEIDGRLLADGSYTMPLPVIEAVHRNMDLILISYTDSALDPNPDSLLASFLNVSRISAKSLRRAQLFGSVNLHNYEICFAPVPLRDPFFPWDVQHIPKIVSAGKQTALDTMPDFLQLYSSFTQFTKRPAAPGKEPADPPSEPDPDPPAA